MKPAFVLFSLVVLAAASSCKKSGPRTPSGYKGWDTYAGTKDASRYSSSENINLQNVSQLKVAWTYSSHDKDSSNKTQDQCNPIMIDGILYGSTPRMKLFALDAATGEQKWLFDPAMQGTSKKDDPQAYYTVCRGVVYREVRNV